MAIEIKTNFLTNLLIVIVNYRTAPLVVDCLSSLSEQVLSLPGTQVVIVDNASGDGSSEAISEAISANGWSHWASLIASEKNGGFSFGNNLAIRSALKSENPPSYFLLLNPDTQVRPRALQALLEFMERCPNAGIAGSSFEDDEGQPWPFAFRFPSIFSEWDYGFRLGVLSKLLSRWTVSRTMGDEEAEVDWLSGACLMIRRQVFESVGLMDEEYFLYYEETDFCLQAKRAGWECWYVPQSRVMHILGQSTGVTCQNQQPKRTPQYLFDSRRRYFLKNYGLMYTALTDTIWIVGHLHWKVRKVIQQKPDVDPPNLLTDFLRNSVFRKPRLSSDRS
jgi:GT2 family glycosyltransferase